MDAGDHGDRRQKTQASQAQGAGSVVTGQPSRLALIDVISSVAEPGGL
jgi:hypothetical protein